MKLVIRGGFQLELAGSPIQEVLPANATRTIGLLGVDSPGIRAELLVSEGTRVAAGTALFRDRKRPELRFTAPVSGTVTGIRIGEKRALATLTIAVAGAERERFPVAKLPDREQTQAVLLSSGLWPSFIARPFGRIPDPGSAPDAIFVTALDTQPFSADAGVVLAQGEGAEDFARGVAALKRLTDGPLFVCQRPGHRWIPDDERIRCVEVSGLHPAGLAGTHISRLFPVAGHRTVWQIHYQDVMAIGTLLRTGELAGERVIALAGSGVRRPRLVRVPPGADLEDLVENELTPGAKELLSGSPLAGRASRFLGRHHWQVSVLPRALPATPPGWFGQRTRAPKPPAIVPTAALERALAADVPIVTLLRALSVGDAETAARVGCRELLEEDLALVTYATDGTQDFGHLLRIVLDELEGER